MNRFLGNIDAKTDIKGRIFIPVSFRKILASEGVMRLVLKKDIYQNCLVLYPENIWEEELSSLRSRLNKWNAEQQQLFRQFVMDTEVLEIDANGRILIPKRYLQLAGIISEVRFLGMDHTVEIWSKDKLENTILDNEAYQQSIQKHLG